ncbi:MAG: enoyl-CoA hydratase/isomerase family protein [Deltaproteobacteria bacterium]|nr:enoyl-CoA hydratase/isomerase family protein [Deltaproteobacteria bacterium]
MAYQNLLLDIAEGIGTVAINRPKALNALNMETLHELQAVFGELEEDDRVGVVILTGSGDRAFVAGADIQEMKEMNCLEAFRFSRLGHETLGRIERMGKVVIAAVNGFALGGGTELALACDFAFASDKAKFGLPEVTLGVFPGFGGTQRLPRLIGKARAKELIFTGSMISAEEARDLGIVNRVFPGDSLMEETRKVAGKIGSNGPIALKLAKASIDRGYEVALEEACHMESLSFGMCFATMDQREGMASFVEKRKPRFVGR